MRFFIFFLFMTAFICLYEAFLSFGLAQSHYAQLAALWARQQTAARRPLTPLPSNVALAHMLHDLGLAVPLGLFCLLMGVVVLLFGFYHLYLVARNTTTNETFKWGDVGAFLADIKRRQVRASLVDLSIALNSTFLVDTLVEASETVARSTRRPCAADERQTRDVDQAQRVGRRRQGAPRRRRRRFRRRRRRVRAANAGAARQHLQSWHHRFDCFVVFVFERLNFCVHIANFREVLMPPSLYYVGKSKVK